MTIETLSSWFSSYVDRFRDAAGTLDPNMELKKLHTAKVVEAARSICDSLGLEGGSRFEALAAAQLHDVGRFEQLKRFGTFSDTRSENHATIAVRVLAAENPLASLSPDSRERIVTAVAVHNAADIPPGLAGPGLLLARIVRDADKIDIYRIVTAYYEHPGHGDETIVHGLPDTDGVTSAVLASIERGERVNYADCRNLNDFKLLQAGWIFDINFPWTVREVARQNYVGRIRATVRLANEPGSDTRRAFEAIEAQTRAECPA